MASVGGFEKQHEVDIDPAKLLAFGIPVRRVMSAIQNANNDVGAMTSTPARPASAAIVGSRTSSITRSRSRGRNTIEGHVPVHLIEKMLIERPGILGLAVPSVPKRPPGMQSVIADKYDVIAFQGERGDGRFTHRIDVQAFA